MKRCKHCRQVKALDRFYGDRAAKDRHRPECKECTAARRKRWYEEHRAEEIARVKDWQQANPDRVNEVQRRRRERPEVKLKERERVLQRKYGIGQAEYEVMLAAQGGVCAICGWPPAEEVSLHVDHDHGRTGRVRALLCVKCNNALGQLNEDPTLVEQAAEYLWRHMTLQRLLALKEA